MTNITLKVGSTIAAAVMIASAFAPSVFADTNLDITGNGDHSNNTIIVNGSGNNGGTSVSQTNNTTAITTVTATSSTGDNTANGNTGGNVSIDTGSATTTVGVSVSGGTNNATLPGCNTCNNGGVTATIDKNGAHSTNTIIVGNGNGGDVWNCGSLLTLGFSPTVTTTNGTNVKQKNNTVALTDVMAGSNTGGNKTKNNTGGSTSITTKHATTTVGVTVTGSSNVLH